MKFIFWLLAISVAAIAQQPTLQDPLLDSMTGKWVLKGEIMGAPTTHDVDIAWVLNHQYVRIHEVSREKTAAGLPQYQADAYLGWDAKRNAYVVHWIDVYGGGFSSMGYAEKAPDSLPFIFKSPDGEFHNTLSFDRQHGQWHWAMDNVTGGKTSPFARLTMTRATKNTAVKK